MRFAASLLLSRFRVLSGRLIAILALPADSPARISTLPAVGEQRGEEAFVVNVVRERGGTNAWMDMKTSSRTIPRKAVLLLLDE